MPSANVCDAVESARSVTVEVPNTTCLMERSTEYLAATLEQALECVDGTDTVHLRLTFDPGFVDNSFGTGSVGWPVRRGHTMDKDLVRSDHAEITAKDAKGTAVVQFKLDYISPDPSQPSGWGSLGVRGGDGAMLKGEPDWIVEWNTSLSRNLNERGYASYSVDSPATDETYTPNPDTPEWDYRVVYEAWVDAAAFGDAGFGGASISFVHASPAKTSSDTLEVEPADCPEPFCQPDDPTCAGTGGAGGAGGGDNCQPDDPSCAGTGGMGGGDNCQPDDPSCSGGGGAGGGAAGGGAGGVGGSGDGSGACGPDDASCTGAGGAGGSGVDCGPDDPSCTGQGDLGEQDPGCAPDDPECFGIGQVPDAPAPEPDFSCPPDWPYCSPE